MTKTKQTIYKTRGGCYHVGKRYFQYLDAALKESTKEECSANTANKGKDLLTVDSEDFADAVMSHLNATDSDIYSVDSDVLNDVLRNIARGR